MYSDMSIRTMARSSSNMNAARVLASSVLPTPEGPRKRKEPIGRLGSARPERLRRDGAGHRRHPGVLAYHPLVEVVLEMDQPGHLALHEARYGDPGPAAHHRRHVLFGDLLAEHGHVALQSGEGLLAGCQLPAQAGEFPVLQLGGALQVSGPGGPVGLHAGILDLLLDRPDRLDLVLLVLPMGGQAVQFLGDLGHLLSHSLHPSLRTLVRLFAQRAGFDLQLAQAAGQGVDLLGHGVDLDAEPGRRPRPSGRWPCRAGAGR